MINSARRNSKSVLGAGTKVEEGAVLVPPVRLYGVVNVDKKSSVGKYSYIGTGSYIVECDIGNYCSIARGVEVGARQHPLTMLSSHPFQYNGEHFKKQPGYHIRTVPQPPREKRQTVVGSDVWIGTKAVIQGGVMVGTGAVVGSSSVVTRDVRPYAIVAGSPAKEIRRRFDDETVERLLSSKWWMLDPVDMNGIDFNDVHAALDALEARIEGLKTKVHQALGGDLKTIAMSKVGILWFDVEKSYADPEALSRFKAARISVGGGPAQDFAIERSWYNLESSRFGVRLVGFAEPVSAGQVTFKLI